MIMNDKQKKIIDKLNKDNKSLNQGHKSAQERTELGDAMECRDKPESADTHEEHQLSLPCVESCIIASERHHNPFAVYPLRQHAHHHRRRDEPGSETR